jgi:DNA replication ATP-dependent helicase Dna2
MLKIATHDAWTPRDQVLALAALQERLFLELTRKEQLAFSTLFARISYAGHQYKLSAQLLRLVHRFRRQALAARNHLAQTEMEVQTGMTALAQTLAQCSTVPVPDFLSPYLLPADQQHFPQHDQENWDFKAKARVVALTDHPEEQYFLAVDAENPAEPIKVRYGLPERNENFNATIRVIQKVFGFPLTLNLLEVEIDRDGAYRPRVFVIEPDYLMDVSAISECYKDTGLEPYAYLARKFLPHETTDPILLGNIANFFLDRLLNEPDIEWNTLFRETFRQFPFAYAPMSDRGVRELSQKAQKHYLNLQQMAKGGLEKQGIDPANCILEPTFFSEQYGIQGRLDLFYKDEEKAAIVELKSGAPFKPNSYGIQRSHFTQTLLYDLLVRSVFGKQSNPIKYILYSGADHTQLRFAPTVVPEQWEALQLRNQLLALERLLAGIRPGDEQVPIFSKLRGSAVTGFLQRDFNRFETAYTRLNLLERKYFNAFVGFIAREHWLSKVGQENQERLNGHAALWRSSFSEKQQDFSILSHLELIENRANQPEPVIIFRKTAETNPLANFRIGDIAALYPAVSAEETILDHQVIRCTITGLEPDLVTVQLRYRQFNLKPFETDALWRLEPDLIETSFANMYRSLFEWAEADTARRTLLLHPIAGLTPSESPAEAENGGTQASSVFEKIIHSKQFFLLWGPPGTGKTSVMLRDLAAWVLSETNDNLLLLAYTNRAVDEICEALESLGPHMRDEYLRIGSRFSTATKYRDQLLNTQIEQVNTRAELRSILEKRRIFVSTVASFSQNEGLLKIKKFQRLMVDEASQLLEPQIIGLLTRFEHTVLIGDHRQLPAITTQQAESTVVNDADLNDIGLFDLRDSYFERLYRLCRAGGLDAHFGHLSHQGRMHQDIMHFPNEHFYDGLLKILPPPKDPKAEHAQEAILWYDLPGIYPKFERIFSEKRVVFLPAPPEYFVPGQKTSVGEADLAVQLIQFFKNLYEFNQIPWIPEKTLGIITPWRAQIAQLRDSLTKAALQPDEITIDTVERYQGGARDIILISCCVHTLRQLDSLVNLSGEGVDRKLNVALTRARKHVVVIGKVEILEQDPRYQKFIQAYSPVEP